jgi:hypothetical protein
MKQLVANQFPPEEAMQEFPANHPLLPALFDPTIPNKPALHVTWSNQVHPQDLRD